jgi:tetratricopeptide (TPR) repeat protein
VHQYEGRPNSRQLMILECRWLPYTSASGRAKALPFFLPVTDNVKWPKVPVYVFRHRLSSVITVRAALKYFFASTGQLRCLGRLHHSLILMLLALTSCQDCNRANAEELKVQMVPHAVPKETKNSTALASEKLELGEMLFFNGNPKAAEKAFTGAIALNPDLYQAHLDLASLYQQNGNLQGAISQYREIVRLHNKERDAYFTLGILLKDQGNLDEAITNLEKALILPSKVQETDTENILAFTLISNGNPSAALIHFEHLLDSSGKAQQPDWILGKAMALFKLNKGTEASIEIDHALSLRPNNPAAHNLKGDVLSASGRKDEAIEEYSKAIQDDPLFYQGYLSLGNLYLKDKQFALAKDIFQKGEKIKPDDKNILYGLAYALENCGDVKAAIEKYQSVLSFERNPSERDTIQAHLRELSGP